MAESSDSGKGLKRVKDEVGRVGKLASDVGSAAKGLFGMGGVSKATGTAAGKAPAAKSGGFKPIRMSAEESARRQKDADAILAKEAEKRRKRSMGKSRGR